MSDTVDNATEKMSELDLEKIDGPQQSTRKKSKKEEAGKFLLKVPKVRLAKNNSTYQKLF